MGPVPLPRRLAASASGRAAAKARDDASMDAGEKAMAEDK